MPVRVLGICWAAREPYGDQPDQVVARVGQGVKTVCADDERVAPVPVGNFGNRDEQIQGKRRSDDALDDLSFAWGGRYVFSAVLFFTALSTGMLLLGAAPYSWSLYWILRTLMPSTSAALLVEPPCASRVFKIA